MKTLSIFVDESGDCGAYRKHSPFYLFSLVLHDQDDKINSHIEGLDRRILEHGFELHAIHTGPIIRNENYYRRFSFKERKRLFNDLLWFTKNVNIKCHTVKIIKSATVFDKMKTEQKVSKKLAAGWQRKEP